MSGLPAVKILGLSWICYFNTKSLHCDIRIIYVVESCLYSDTHRETEGFLNIMAHNGSTPSCYHNPASLIDCSIRPGKDRCDLYSK